MSGSTIYGVNTQTYHHLPPEDQAAIRQQYLASPTSAPEPEAPATPAPTTTPAATPATAQTPAEAVTALHALQAPTYADLPSGMGEYARQATYQGRVEAFNQNRATQAQAALDRFAPQREDFTSAGLNGRTAEFEYEQARTAYNADPYVAELRRIVTEANANPTQLPAYLEPSATAPANNDVGQFTPEQIRGALGMVGVQLPADASAEMLDAGRELLRTMPDDMLAMVVNPGSQVSFSGGTGLGTPNLVGPNARYDVEITGQVELSDVQTGVNFNQTQQFEAYVQTQAGTTFDLSKSAPQSIYKWSGRLDNLPGWASQQLEKIPGFNQLDNALRSAGKYIDDVPGLRQVLKGLPVSGSYSTFEGARLSYEAVVTPEQGALLANGNTDGMPNPLDPLNMPEGTSVLMRGQTLTGSTFEANYKAFTVGGTHTELSGMGFGITRGEGSIVEIYSGPVETVENSAFLGLGRQGTLAIGIGSDTSMETRNMQVARIDLSTAEGQAAYQAFISGGRVPDWAPPGVQQSGTTEVFSHEYASFIGLQVGGLSIGGSSDANGTITQTTWADGTIEYGNTYTSASGVTTDVRGTVGADGNLDQATAQWTVVRADLDPILASYLNASYNTNEVNKQFDGPQHAQISFNSAQLMEMRDRARESVVALNGQEKLDNLDSGLESPWWSATSERLAVCKTPDEVFAVLSDDFHGGTVIEGMLSMSFEHGASTGSFRMIDAG